MFRVFCTLNSNIANDVIYVGYNYDYISYNFHVLHIMYNLQAYKGYIYIYNLHNILQITQPSCIFITFHVTYIYFISFNRHILLIL